MKKLAMLVGVVVLVIIVSALALPHLIDVNQYRGQIQAEVQKQLNRPVQLGQMSLSVFPLALAVENVSIADAPNFHSSVPFAQVQKLDVSVKLLPLLTKDIQVKSLHLQHPRIELIRSAEGAWNFASLGHIATAPQPGQAPAQPPQAPRPVPAQQAQGQSSAFVLGELKITDGQIAVTDLEKHQSRVVYDHIDASLKDYARGKPFSLEVAAHLPGSGSQTLQLSGEGGPINDAQVLNTPFRGTVKMNQVSLSGAQKFLNTAALEGTDAMLSGSIDFSNATGKISARGSLKMDDAVVHDVKVGYPIEADFDVTDDLTNDVIQISRGKIKLGSTPVSLNGTVNTHAIPAAVDVHVSASDASIEEAARLAAAFGVAFSPNAKITGKLTADVHAQGPTDHLALNGTVNGRGLEITGKDIPQSVRVPQIDLAMTPQDIRSNSFTATAGSTTLNAQMALSQYTGNSPSVDATLKTNNAKVDELLSIAKAYGVSAAEGMSGTGNTTLDVHASGPIKNTDAMTFSGSGAIQNAVVKMPQLTQPLNIKNVNLQFTQNTVNLANLGASLGSTNASGNVSVTNFRAPRLTFALNADKINVGELQKILAAPPPAQKTPEKKKAEASWSLVPVAEGASAAAAPSLLDTVTGTGTLAVGSIVYDKTDLTNVRSNVTLNHGVIQLSPATGNVYGGQMNAAITIDTRPAVTTYAVNGKLVNADNNQMLSALSNVKDTIYGTVSSNMNLSFSTPPSGDVTPTLNGTLGLNLVNGKITKLDLLNELSKIGKFGAASKGYTAISRLTGTLDIRNGVAQTNDVKAAMDGGTMAAAGTMNLVNQALNMHVTAVLDKAFSQSVGGTGIGGYLNTALANKNGELVLPVLVTGTTSHPVVAPDVQKIAQMKVNNLLPTAGGLLNGKGGNDLGGLVGGLFGGQQQQAGKPGQPQQQSNPLNDALGQLLGGKKKKK